MHGQLDENLSTGEDDSNRSCFIDVSIQTTDQLEPEQPIEEQDGTETLNNQSTDAKATLEEHTTDTSIVGQPTEPLVTEQSTSNQTTDEPIVNKISTDEPLADEALGDGHPTTENDKNEEASLQANDNSISETISMCFKFLADNSQLAKLYYSIGSEICDVTQWYKLTFLDLRYQNISKLNYFDINFPMLETLNVSHNELISISGLPNSLQCLYAANNKLIEIDINHLERLEILDVSKNKIMNFKDMSRLKSLRTLNAGYNNIETCSIFENLPCLISLNLTHNKIRRLNGLLIANMSMLEILDVSFNLIERLTSIETLQNLVEFNMSSNNAISISLTRTINRLCNLNLSFNRLTEFDAKWFPNARIVYLDENIITRVYELTSIPRVTSFSLRNQEDLYNFDLYYLRSTRKLYLSGYPFRRMTQFFDFFTLKYLELCSAELDELPADFSNRAPNLSRLHLSMNRLQDIRPLKPLKELKQLVLLGNNLVSILDIISVVKHLEKLVVLDLRKNPVNTGYYPPVKRPKHGSLFPYIDIAHDPKWETKNLVYCDYLSNDLFRRRKIYRDYVINSCPNLQELDHLSVSFRNGFRR